MSYQDDLNLVRSCVDPLTAGCQYPCYHWLGVPKEYGIYTSVCLDDVYHSCPQVARYKEMARPLLDALARLERNQNQAPFSHLP